MTLLYARFFSRSRLTKTFGTIFQRYSLKEFVPRMTSIKGHLFQVHALVLLIQGTSPSQMGNR